MRQCNIGCLHSLLKLLLPLLMNAYLSLRLFSLTLLSAAANDQKFENKMFMIAYASPRAISYQTYSKYAFKENYINLLLLSRGM